MQNIRVIPARAGMHLRHQPSGIELADEGGLWPNDSFTARRLVDQDVTRAPDESDAAATANASDAPSPESNPAGESAQPIGQAAISAENVAQDVPVTTHPGTPSRKLR